MSQSSLVDYGWFVCETDAVQFAYAMESMQGRSVYSDSGSPRSSKICPLVDENGSEVEGVSDVPSPHAIRVFADSCLAGWRGHCGGLTIKANGLLYSGCFT